MKSLLRFARLHFASPDFARLLSLTLICLVALSPCRPARAADGDTIRVKTLTFSDITKRSGTWLFPPPDKYQKVLMEYTLKCDQATTQDNYPCGEWDYLTYTVLTDSTGEFDSSKAQQVNFMVRGGTPDSFQYVTTPVVYKQRFQELRVTPNTPANLFTVGSSDQANSSLFRTNGGRVRFIWQASELTAAGVQAGKITGISIRAIDSLGTVTMLTISMGQTTSNTLPAIMTMSGLTTMASRNVFIDNGDNFVGFSSGFNWDGTSNIVVDMTCVASPKDGSVEASTPPVGGITDDGSRRAYQFTQGDYLDVPAAIGADLSKEITVAFWSWGVPGKLPKDHNTLEAYDAAGNRIINIHCPWGDGTVYWDAGRNSTTGAVDRVQRAAIPENFEGQWNHWAFTKNTAGNMRIYLNGEIFVEGNSKTASMAGITRFLIGSGNSGSYEGFLDEIQVWKKALSQETIKQWMSKHISSLHPDFGQLLCFYSCEKESIANIADCESEFGRHAPLFGLPRRAIVSGQMLGYLTAVSGSRPVLSFEQGASTRQSQTASVDVALEPVATHVVIYGNPVQPRVYQPTDPTHPSRPTDTLLTYQAGWVPIVNEAFARIDSEMVTPTQTLRKVVSPYFSPIVQFEIGRYITPYGIGLDLGPNGFKWVYDVTDFAPLLRNNVTLSAGNQQELIDLTFVFIKGTPPRDVKQIDQVWYDRGAMFPAVLNSTALPAITVALDPQASTFRFKAVTSGHDFSNETNCAEFCPREHFLSIDGTERFKWTLWKECGDNPVFPQGGTWLIDRTGWCPGAPVDLYEFELTPYATGKTSLQLDYGIKKQATNENWGRWEVSGQLIGYGAPNHTLDVELLEVLSPNSWEFYGRMNPICGQPIVVIRNSGSAKLTSCTIEYGQEDGAKRTFNWTGDLNFMQTDTVVLDQPALSVDEGQHVFTVQAFSPNGDVDQYQSNNGKRTTFFSPPVYYNDLQIVLRTNLQASAQYEWRLKNVNGTTIGTGNNLSDTTTYTYDFLLDDGCYDFELINKEGYGLDFWFLRDQLGSGYLMFKSGGVTIKNFESDFGNKAWMQFSVWPKPTIATNEDTLFFYGLINEKVTERVAVVAVGEAPLTIDSVNVFSVRGHFSIENTSTTLPATLGPSDTLWVTVAFQRNDAGSSSGTLRMFSNDERSPATAVRLVGNAVITGVNEEESGYAPEIDVVVAPNPATSGALIYVQPTLNSAVIGENISIRVVDLTGRIEATVFEGVMNSDMMTFEVPSSLTPGTHIVTVKSSQGISTTFFVFEN